MNAVCALALSGGKDPPLIDVDGTVFIQLALFLAVAYALSELLFKPFLRVRAAREAGIEGAREEATRLEEEAGARLADYEQRIGKARREAHDERHALHAEAVKAERAVQDAALGQTQKVVADARAQIQRDADRTERELEPRTREIAEVIAGKVLGRRGAS
jgi:F-type H+-transporting ATPase subunit b